jgi:hypothetical protein
MRFAGGDREATLPVQVDFGPADACFLQDLGVCPQARKTVDLTPVIPADAPVELSITLKGNGNYNFDFATTDATLLRSDENYQSGTILLDATLVRSGSGTVTLVVDFEFASVDAAAQGAGLKGTAHSVARADVVPPFVPVAVDLRPNDTLATFGGSVQQLVVFPPGGLPALRDLTVPFNVTIPADAPAGTYLVMVAGDDATTLFGPDAPLKAHLLAFVQGPPTDLAPNGETAWDFTLDGQPVEAGVLIESKDAAPGVGGPVLLGSHSVTLTSPQNVDVLGGAGGSTCLATCGFTALGRESWAYGSPFLEEHLVPGAYHATVKADASQGLAGSTWAVLIK